MIKGTFKNIREEIISELRTANKSLKIAMAYFTDDELFSLLQNISEQGIVVELILANEEQNFKGLIDFSKLKTCYFYQNDTSSLMHHKFAIIDDEKLITGSYNWTIKAGSNKENIIITDETELIEKYSWEFESLKKHCKNDLKSISKPNHIADILEQLEKESSISYIPTFFENLDNLFAGFGKGELTLIAGNKGVGSTSLMFNCINNILINTDNRIGLISLDLSTHDTVKRFINLLDNGYNEDWLKKKPLFIKYPAIIYIQELYKACLDLVYKHDVKAIFIDSFKSLDIRGEYYSNISQKKIVTELCAKELKKIARLLNIPIIISASLERTVEERNGDKRPHKRDIPVGLDSFPDNTLLIHRPEMHGITEDAEGNSTIGFIEIISFRNDFSKAESIQMKFDSELQKYIEYTPEELTPLDVIPSKMNDSDENSDKNRFPDFSPFEQDSPF